MKWKKEVKLFLFLDDMVLYLNDLIDSTKEKPKKKNKKKTKTLISDPHLLPSSSSLQASILPTLSHARPGAGF
jgi:hypothetical protein